MTRGSTTPKRGTRRTHIACAGAVVGVLVGAPAPAWASTPAIAAIAAAVLLGTGVDVDPEQLLASLSRTGQVMLYAAMAMYALAGASLCTLAGLAVARRLAVRRAMVLASATMVAAIGGATCRAFVRAVAQAHG